MSRIDDAEYHDWEQERELDRLRDIAVQPPPGWDAMCREHGDLQAANEWLRDALEQIETLARNALTKPYEALRLIESLASTALGSETRDEQ